jgi:acetate kinase
METTMGMTPLGGFMMGTRTGDMDPGVLLYLARERRYTSRRLEQLLDKDSGLKGVSGTTADMETLLRLRTEGDPAATQAVDMFCYQAGKTIGSLAAALGGLDLLVFTGGMGENAAQVRALVCARLGHLGITLDPAKNEAALECVSVDGTPCSVMVVHTNEDLMIARHTYRTVFGAEL